jgi:hypothetical protein
MVLGSSRPSGDAMTGLVFALACMAATFLIGYTCGRIDHKAWSPPPPSAQAVNAAARG